MARRREPERGALEEAEELLRLVNESCIVELEASWNGTTVRVRKDSALVEEASAAQVEAAPAETPTEGATETVCWTVAAPVVGRFWRGAGPGSPPFVEAGQLVEAGQQLGTVESLAAPVEVLAEHAGAVQEILAEEGRAVGYGDPLFSIRRLHA